MVLKNKKFFFFLFLFSSFFNYTYAKETILTDDIKITNINNNPYNFQIQANLEKLPKNEFEYYKIVHSITNPSIIYPDGFIWYTQIVDDLNANNNFFNYTPNLNGINYYRVCFVTAKKIFCSKNDYKVNFSGNNGNISNTKEIKEFLSQNTEVIPIIQNSEYLQRKTRIYYFDNDNLVKFFQTTDEMQLVYVRKVFGIIKNDVSINNNLSNFKTIDDINSNINLIKESINKLGDYGLNNDILNKLQDEKKSIEDRNTLQEEIKNKISSSRNLLSSLNLSFSSEMNSRLGSFKSSMVSNSKAEIDSDYTELENFKKSIQEKIDENKSYLDSTTLTQSDKKKLQDEIDNLNKSLEEINNLLEKIENLKKENNQILKFNMKLFGAIIILLGLVLLFLLWYLRVKNKKNPEEKILDNFKILQIIKNGNEYSIEYDGNYSKGIKVLENTKKSIKNSIYNFVKASNLFLKTRGILDELEKLDIEVPDLSVSGNTIFKLFINDSIKEKLFSQKETLIIKTDEQEIPWEIMHNGETFLSLRVPIARQIMTRESIRKNKEIINKKPKILFIVNPTGDLLGTEKEVEGIIKNISGKVDLKILKQKNANLVNVISELSRDNYDIIHYSGHAYFDKEKPDESGLILHEKEILSSTEIKRLIEGNPLIFLNSCSSGESSSDNEENFKNNGEDTIGLATSFMIGGAKGVIATLWPINDKTAAFFAIDFYMRFLQKETLGNALLNAKKETYMHNMKDPTWASFIYYGDPNFKINIK